MVVAKSGRHIPWWLRLEGGEEAAGEVLSYVNMPALKDIYEIKNRTRLAESPEVFAAVSSARVPYSHARKLDVAYQASRAAKVKSIYDDAGIPESMRDPRVNDPAAAYRAAERKKLEIDQQQRSGFWGSIGGFLGDTAGAVWDFGKKVVEGAGDALEFVGDIVEAPLSAGQSASEENRNVRDAAAQSIPVLGMLGVSEFFGDLGAGVAQIVSGDIEDSQKEDMKRAGYDPDSMIDRYKWYGDLDDKHSVMDERTVSEAKQQFNPYKVDLARELLTLGVHEDPNSLAGASDEAQKFFYKVTQEGGDKEGLDIIEKLLGSHFGPGRNLADNLHLYLGGDRDSGAYTAAEVVGDLAGYWYVDPGMVAGKGLAKIRNHRWAVDFDPVAVKDAIVKPGRIAKVYDSALDYVDNIYLLKQSKRVEDQVEAARQYQRFTQKHADLVPHYETLYKMRSGQISGTYFKDPSNGGKVRSIADMKSGVIGLKHETDVLKQQPMWSLRSSIGAKVSDEARTEARAAIADVIGDSIFASAVTAGRPIFKNKMLMPGQVRISYPLRAALRPLTESSFGKSGLLMKQLKNAEGKGLIDFARADNADAALSGIIDSAKGGEFIRSKYTKGGLRDRMGRTLNHFAVFRDSAVLKLDGPDTTKTFHDFVRPFLPRGQSAFLAARWAAADPATRSVMANQMWDMLAGVRHSSKNGDDFWRQALKGRQSVVMPGEMPKEAYSTAAKDLLDTEAGKISAAMYSTQFADGLELPSYLDIIRNTERVGLFGHLLGWSNNVLPSRATRVVKVGQVGTTSNLLRQWIEGRTTQFLEAPADAVRTTLAKIGLSGERAAARAQFNDAVRQAKKLTSSGAMEKLTPLQAFGDWNKVADEAAAWAGGKLNPALDDLLRSGAKLEDIASRRSGLRLAATKFGGVDPLRKVRASIYRQPDDVNAAYDWLEHVDDKFADELAGAAYRIIGSERANYINAGLVDDMEQIADGVAAGQRLQSVRLANTHGYLGAAGDSGAMRWSVALAHRQADEVGNLALRAVALDTLGKAGGKQSWQKLRREILAARAGSTKAKDIRAWLKANPEAAREFGDMQSPADLISWVLRKEQVGETYRLNGRRAQYLDGKFIADPANRDLALSRWAEDMVDDAAHYLGAKQLGDEVPDTYRKFLTKVARVNSTVSADDLAKLPNELRPAEVAADIIVGKKFLEGTGNLSETVARGASKWYNFVVARPLHRMLSEPQAVAAHREIMDALEPFARSLKTRGMSDQSIYNVVQELSWSHAITRVTRYSDNPEVTSYFAVLSNNFLFYERAMEDFMRRAMRIVRADPAVFSKAYLMTEAGLHSGLMDKVQVEDEDGTTKTEYMFTWPGSGLMMRAVNEGLQALGVADTVQVPVWQDFTSPVKYLSPSLQSPIGFTTTPLLGIPGRALKVIFPDTAPTVDTIQTALEGGERSFGAQGLIESFLPVFAKRLWNTFDEEQRTSQFMSSYRNALAYYQAAGLLPEADAPESEKAKALDGIATMVQNQLVVRSLFASFAPATPGLFGSNVSGIGDDALNVLDRARGVTTVKQAWFTLMEDMMQKFDGDAARALSETHIEWARRDLGSIVNPGAITVGSSGEPQFDSTGKSFSSNLDLTQWMLSNKQFIDEFGPVAYAVLPSVAGGEYYDAVGYRLQLRQGLRQHKTGKEFYEDLWLAQGWRDFNQAQRVRDSAIEAGENPDRAKKWFKQHTEQLKMSNPIWGSKSNRFRTADYVSNTMAPLVRKLADAVVLPEPIGKIQREVKVLADLYDEYRTLRDRYSNNQGAKIGLATRYKATGDRLFKGGPIDDLWSAMQIWED